MSHVISFEGAMKKDLHLLHRVTQFDLHDESCAEEGGKWREANAAADAPDLYGSAPKVPRSREPVTTWGSGPLVFLVVIAGAMLSVWAVLS
jgi:hypothetical protein